MIEPPKRPISFAVPLAPPHAEACWEDDMDNYARACMEYAAQLCDEVSTARMKVYASADGAIAAEACAAAIRAAKEKL